MSRVDGLLGNIWPEPRDVLLLRFLLHLDPAEAVGAWGQWRPGWDPEAPTPEQYQLFPFMAERVAALVPSERYLGMLQGVRRQSTVRTLIMLDELDAVLSTLEEIGADGVVLKGPALAHSVYDHAGQRSFHDLDVLVDPRRQEEAVGVLTSKGWTLRVVEFRRERYHVCLERSGVQLEVHRTHSKELVITGASTSGWDNIETEVAPRSLRSGRSMRILAPADALLHTITHGTAPVQRPILRWVADAQRLMLFSDVDWERVIRLAALFEVAPIVHDALEFVSDTTGVSPPPEVPTRLKGIRIRKISRRRIAAFHEVPRVREGLGRRMLTDRIRYVFRYTMDQSWPELLAFAAEAAGQRLRRHWQRGIAKST